MMVETAEQAPLSGGSLAIAAFSAIVEWYFTLFLYFAMVLSRVFFGPAKCRC